MVIGTLEQRTSVDIFDLIVSDHRKISELTYELEVSEHPTERARIFDELRIESAAHGVAEDAAFYVRLARSSNLSLPSLIARARRVHGLVDKILEDLAVLNPADAVWMAKARSLRARLEEHMDEEEGSQFALARKTMSPAERVTLGRVFFELKTRAAGEARARSRGLLGKALD